MLQNNTPCHRSIKTFQIASALTVFTRLVPQRLLPVQTEDARMKKNWMKRDHWNRGSLCVQRQTVLQETYTNIRKVLKWNFDKKSLVGYYLDLSIVLTINSRQSPHNRWFRMENFRPNGMFLNWHHNEHVTIVSGFYYEIITLVFF